MKKAQQKRYESLYQNHLNALQRQGKSKATIEAYSRAVRRISSFFDRCPDKLTTGDLKDYFTALVNSHSWSTVKIDRNGLQFFYKHVIAHGCAGAAKHKDVRERRLTSNGTGWILLSHPRLKPYPIFSPPMNFR